jgi:sulfate permease, SulP family
MTALGPFSSLRGYQREWLRSDAVAGLTVWAVLVPESLAYGALAGASPVVGLYAVPGALILYAAFGSSRHLVTAPMSATAALSAGAIAQFVTGGGTNAAALTAAVAIATGIAAVLAGVLRLGFVATLISEPVLKGFIIGIALTIIAGQLSKLLGIHGLHAGNFFETIWTLIKHLGDAHGASVAVGLSSLALILVLEHFAPRIPAMLVVVVFGIVVVKAFNLEDHGVEIVGKVPSGLPKFGLPDVAAKHYLVLGRDALAIMLLSFVEGLAAAKGFAAKGGYELDANRELIGLGAANLGSGLSGGMVAGGSVGKTAVSGGAGARTQLSGIVAAALVVVTLLFLTGLFKDLPEPTLAAIVIGAVVGLVDIAAMREIWGVRGRELIRVSGLPVAARPDFIAAVAALFGVLIFEALPGLFIGLAISLLLLLFRTSRPHLAVLGRIPDTNVWADVDRHPDLEPAAGVLVVRPESGLFFVNADNIHHALRRLVAEQHLDAVVLDLESVPGIDMTAVEMLHQVRAELEAASITLYVTRDIGQVRKVLGRTEPDVVGAFPSVQAAVEHIRGGEPPADPG